MKTLTFDPNYVNFSPSATPPRRLHLFAIQFYKYFTLTFLFLLFNTLSLESRSPPAAGPHTGDDDVYKIIYKRRYVCASSSLAKACAATTQQAVCG